jgi:putative hydrolase of the HAD superfamily
VKVYDPAQFKYILFDLDDTLYPKEAGVMEAIIKRIMQFMVHRVNIPPDDVSMKRYYFYQQYGTVLRGLMEEYQIDPAAYLDYVHDINLPAFLGPSPPLDRMLTTIPLRKIVFTNADRQHSERILNTLKVRQHFELIFDIRATNFKNKPDPLAYQHVLNSLAVSGRACIMVEDSPRNLIPAKDCGMLTILVGDGPKTEAIDYIVPTIFHVEQVIQNVLSRGG